MNDQPDIYSQSATTQPGGNVYGAIFNLVFSLYYYVVYHLLHDQVHIVVDYKWRSPIHIPLPLAIVILIMLLAEPFAAWYKIAYENYKSNHKIEFRLPGLYAFIVVVCRILVRIILIMAALEACGILPQDGSVMAYIILIFVFLEEVFLVFMLNDTTGVILKPSKSKEIMIRLVLINILALFTFMFHEMFLKEFVIIKDVYTQKDILMNCLVCSLLFFFVYLPNVIIEFYSDWIDQKTWRYKILYIASVIFVYLTIIFV